MRPALIVLVDAWISLGGSQFINSPATDRYLDYLCDEVVLLVDANYQTSVRPESRAAGKSSDSCQLLPKGLVALGEHMC